MNYQEFKDHLVTFLWKSGDTQLINSLDNLIRMADAELNRKLLIERRNTSATLVVNQLDTPLPADYLSIKSVADSDGSLGEFSYKSPAQIQTLRNVSSVSWLPVYSLLNKTLLLVGPATIVDPISVLVNYRIGVPNFQADDTSWLADEYLDLYTYAVLKQSSTFLREDERLPVWAGLYVDALESALDLSAHEQSQGVYASKPLPQRAGIRRRR